MFNQNPLSWRCVSEWHFWCCSNRRHQGKDKNHQNLHYKRLQFSFDKGLSYKVYIAYGKSWHSSHLHPRRNNKKRRVPPFTHLWHWKSTLTHFFSQEFAISIFLFELNITNLILDSFKKICQNSSSWYFLWFLIQ